MKKFNVVLISITFLLISCNQKVKEDTLEQWKNEIVETEKSFSKMASKEGIPKAFLAYAAEDAVLMRNNTLIIGKEALEQHFGIQNASAGQNSLEWEPDFVDVAASGDLGYTYGKFVYTSVDSTGAENSIKGIFHTVWKRQKDGTWRFVWD
jgi:ketosteroid isomerase-like protein